MLDDGSEDSRVVMQFGSSRSVLSDSGVVQLLENHNAGRYTVREVAQGLAEKTSCDYQRWLAAILAAVDNGNLRLRNPRNLADNLQYYPKERDALDAHLLAREVNVWLDAHPDYTDFRFGAVQAPASARRKRHTQNRDEVLAALLQEIERKAEAEAVRFDRGLFPGIKQEFREFAVWRCPELNGLPSDISRLGDELKRLGVAFSPGNNSKKGRKFFKRLFPDYP